MTIERMGPIDPIQKFNKPEKVNKPQAQRAGDSITVSDEAKVRAELLQAVDQVKSMPDIRQDRVDAVKARLEDPSYIDDRVISLVADEIMSAFDIG